MLTKGCCERAGAGLERRRPGDQLRGQRLAEPESERTPTPPTEPRRSCALRTDGQHDETADVGAPCAPWSSPAPRVTSSRRVASKIRMITYYIDNVTDPRRPRLVRRMNNGVWNDFDNSTGTAVAFDIEGLHDQLRPGGRREQPVERADGRRGSRWRPGPGGALRSPCYANQIRKINICCRPGRGLPRRGTQQFFRNRLSRRSACAASRSSIATDKSFAMDRYSSEIEDPAMQSINRSRPSLRPAPGRHRAHRDADGADARLGADGRLRRRDHRRHPRERSRPRSDAGLRGRARRARADHVGPVDPVRDRLLAEHRADHGADRDSADPDRLHASSRRAARPDRAMRWRRGSRAGGNPAPGRSRSTAARSPPDRTRVSAASSRPYDITVDGALARRRRSAHASDAADGRDSGVPVRHVLGDGSRVPRGRRPSTWAAACTPTATCSWPRPTATP